MLVLSHGNFFGTSANPSITRHTSSCDLGFPLQVHAEISCLIKDRFRNDSRESFEQAKVLFHHGGRNGSDSSVQRRNESTLLWNRADRKCPLRPREPIASEDQHILSALVCDNYLRCARLDVLNCRLLHSAKRQLETRNKSWLEPAKRAGLQVLQQLRHILIDLDASCMHHFLTAPSTGRHADCPDIGLPRSLRVVGSVT
jgi:hypothetical protein